MQRDYVDNLEDLKKQLLCKGAPLPSLGDLMEFWVFHHKSSNGRIVKLPTMKTLLGQEKRFKGGWARWTGTQMSDELTEAVNKVFGPHSRSSF